MPKCSAPGELEPAGIDLVARPLGVEAAAELDQRAADQHVAQHHRLRRCARHLDDRVVLEAHADALRERLLESDRPLRVDRARDRHRAMLRRIVEHGPRLVEVRAVRRQVVNVRARARREHLAAPAVGVEVAVGHARGERDDEVASAAVGERQHVVALLRGMRAAVARTSSPTSSVGKRACARVQQVEVAEERDLDPALPEPAPQVDAVRMPGRAEPRRAPRTSPARGSASPRRGSPSCSSCAS